MTSIPREDAQKHDTSQSDYTFEDSFMPKSAMRGWRLTDPAENASARIPHLKAIWTAK
jgi:hypothetical protein